MVSIRASTEPEGIRKRSRIDDGRIPRLAKQADGNAGGEDQDAEADDPGTGLAAEVGDDHGAHHLDAGEQQEDDDPGLGGQPAPTSPRPAAPAPRRAAQAEPPRRPLVDAVDEAQGDDRQQQQAAFVPRSKSWKKRGSVVRWLRKKR